MVGLRLEEIPGPKTSFFKEIVLSHSVDLLFMHTEPKDRVEKITLLLTVRYVDRETVSKHYFSKLSLWEEFVDFKDFVYLERQMIGLLAIWLLYLFCTCLRIKHSAKLPLNGSKIPFLGGNGIQFVDENEILWVLSIF